ncbi:CBN-GST-33 protein [Caenorhabditis brenneri]|uniref:glutathione transferase n=1 Tax=Caenorhabditis brenneri TaxID=135651 RepID=G0P0J6_CAEBE|nr:CBN-GST-33 protein [Caenorhabditis brenneri]
MTKYRIHFYNARGHSVVFRDMFQMAGVDYEDVLHEESDKEKMPFGHMPVLEVDGELIPQSGAINRFIANILGFAGQTPVEKAWADAFADLYNDFLGEVKAWGAVAFKGQPGDKDELKKTVFDPAKENYFKRLSQRLEKSKSGFLLDSGISYPDLMFFETSSLLEGFEPTYFGSELPLVKEYFDRIGEHPKLKPYLEARKKQ